MGYDITLEVFKKKTLDRLQKEMPEHSLANIYSHYLFAWMYPEDYEIPEGEEGKCIFSESQRIFQGFFDKDIENGEAIIIDKETYNKMFQWLEQKLKSTSLFDFVDANSPINESDIYPFIRVYEEMRDAVINFDEEIVIFQHDW